MEENLRRFGAILVKLELVALAVGMAQILFWPAVPRLIRVWMNVIFVFGVLVGLLSTMVILLARHRPRW